MSVKEAQEKIDSAEFSEWIAYHNVDPFTFHRTENMLAVIATIMANTHRGKGSRTYKPEDFMPIYGIKRKETSGSNLEIKLRSILNGNY